MKAYRVYTGVEYEHNRNFTIKQFSVSVETLNRSTIILKYCSDKRLTSKA